MKEILDEPKLVRLMHPSQIASPHRTAFGFGGIILIGQMVEAVCDVERKLVVGRPVVSSGGVMVGALGVDK